MKKFLSAIIACTLAASMFTTPALALSVNYGAEDSKTVVLGGDGTIRVTNYALHFNTHMNDGEDTSTDADTENASSDYNYVVLEDGTVSIQKYNGKDENLVIPSEIEGKPVTSLGVNSFGINQNIKTVIIPNTVTVIDNLAFTYCMNITGITIPGSVVTISDGAFNNCEKLDKVVVPDSVKSIGVRAFGDNKALTAIEFSDNNTTFADGIFHGCTNLKDIYFTGSEADFNNAKISALDRKIFADNNVTVHYGSHMPSDNSAASDFNYITNEDDGGSIRITAYKGSDKDVVVPSMIDGKKVTKIDNYAFSDNTGITSVKLPDTVTDIDSNAFSEIKNVTIICNPGSYAEEFAKKHGISYAYPGSDTEKIGLLGDVNGDKKVTAKDSMLIQRYVVKLISLDDNQLRLADVDGNNKVTNADSLNILRYTIHANVKYPIGTEV